VVTATALTGVVAMAVMPARAKVPLEASARSFSAAPVDRVVERA
jgi:hypothetical protein